MLVVRAPCSTHWTSAKVMQRAFLLGLVFLITFISLTLLRKHYCESLSFRFDRRARSPTLEASSFPFTKYLVPRHQYFSDTCLRVPSSRIQPGAKKTGSPFWLYIATTLSAI